MITATVNDRTYKLGEFYRYPVFTGATDTIEFYVDMENKDQVDFIDFIKDNNDAVNFDITLTQKTFNCKANIINHYIDTDYSMCMYYVLKVTLV